MDPDEAEYKKNVKTMSVVLAVIVITVFAGLFLAPYLQSTQSFQESVSVPSIEGFNLELTVNTTSVAPGGFVNITALALSTGKTIENITAQDAWPVASSRLWLSRCGEPVGVGVMEGYYTSDNYTQGSLVSVGTVLGSCLSSPPQYFLFEPNSSEALVVENGTGSTWTIGSTLVFGPLGGQAGSSNTATVSGSTLPTGVYTVVAADEWGDIALTNFQVT